MTRSACCKYFSSAYRFLTAKHITPAALALSTPARESSKVRHNSGGTRNRWGDYSATVIDPVDPCTFWTFQEFVAVSAGDRDVGGSWGIQITELTFNNCEGQPNFIDVPPGYWAEDYIYAIFDAGITQGCSQTPLRYCPEASVTREQMAAFIVRAVEGEPAANYCDTGSPFSDVSPASIFCKYIKRLYELEITTGCGAGIYCPEATVSRAQMAAFLARAFLGLE